MDFRSRAANDPKESLRIEESDLLAEAASIPDPDIFQKQFREIDLRFDRSDEIFWCYMNQKSRPSYTYELGDEIQQVQDWIHSNYAMDGSKAADPLRYFVCGSRTPGIYNLGGDLKHFAACIRRRDLGALKKYARTCVHMQYENSTGFGAPIITMALVASCGSAWDGRIPSASFSMASFSPLASCMTWVWSTFSLKMAWARLRLSNIPRKTANGSTPNVPSIVPGKSLARSVLKSCWRLPIHGRRPHCIWKKQMSGRWSGWQQRRIAAFSGRCEQSDGQAAQRSSRPDFLLKNDRGNCVCRQPVVQLSPDRQTGGF